jgi:hypothetical protein
MTMDNSTRIKDADYAREAVKLVSSNKNKAARERFATLVKTCGNYDSSGLAIFAQWEALGCPRDWSPPA